ncbi:pyridoxamine 5'-phosphate oxidase family protein [Glycomyces sp. L485]|nr:pyridoxamine 5'-phosphate oxidase family protein [Glycomyces sp. L485]
MKTQRNLVELDRAQALGLLERAPFGRVAFISEGFPTIRPYNHVVVDGEIIVHTRQSTAFAQAVIESAGLEVAFQADEIEPHHRLGWSVVVSGIASEMTDRRRAEPLARQVRTWIDHPMNTVIVIKPQVVSGFRLTVAN